MCLVIKGSECCGYKRIQTSKSYGEVYKEVLLVQLLHREHILIVKHIDIIHLGVRD